MTVTNAPPGEPPVEDTVPSVDDVVDPADNDAVATPTRYALLDKAITREQLRVLRIRVFTDVAVPVEGCTTPSKLWLIGESGLRKLREAKYTTEAPEPIDGMANTLYIHLSNPDGSQALAGVDPKTIRIVRVSSWSGGAAPLNSWFVEQVKETLSQAVDVPIHVTLRDGTAATPATALDSPTFNLVIGSSPSAAWSSDQMRANASDRFTPPEQLWGIAPPHREPTNVAAWLGGTPLCTPEGIEIGAIDGRNMFVYYKAASVDSEEAKKILRHILDLAVVVYKDPASAAIPEGVARVNYTQACTARVAVERKEAQTAMAAASERVAKLQADMVSAVRMYNDSMTIIDRLSSSESELLTFLGHEFDLLKANVKVKSVGWRGASLIVDTVVLCASAPTGPDRTECEYEIGEFTITICSTRGSTTFYNKTRRVNGLQNSMHAPHIYADGHACLGTANETIPRLVASYKWSLAVALSIEFLESVNIVDQAGRHVVNWPFSQRQLALNAETLAKQMAS